ncbi:hypothetical protein Acr_03g0019220 [Actinidia rufa]|uniref:Uncharacterized protein n=1 Tax=Actinidia rufa TaxID=165716 RepID=A0A7J0EF90_9ERIC|nr:hypothetical protein Acr_03g0019220 [Actinidia rufa]
MDHGEILGRIGMERYLGDVGDIIGKIAIWRVSRNCWCRDGENLASIKLSILPRPRARRRQHLSSGRSDEYSEGSYGELNGDDLARFHGLVLPRSRGFGDIKFGVLNAMELRRMNVRRCSVPLGAR